MRWGQNAPANNALERDLHLASHGFPPGSAGVPARILVKALLQRQSAGEPTHPVKPIATTLPGRVRAGRPRSQGQQLFPTINPAS